MVGLDTKCAPVPTRVLSFTCMLIDRSRSFLQNNPSRIIPLSYDLSHELLQYHRLDAIKERLILYTIISWVSKIQGKNLKCVRV